MQDAYFQEKNEVGDWTEIGYSAPGTGSSHSYESGNFAYTDGGDGVNNWMADPKVKLNDCQKADAGTGSWKLEATANAADNTATSFEIKDGSQGGSDCLNLTASWSSLTRSSN